jgi:hypothetical protein
MDETQCKYVGSFALLKSATHRSPVPVSDFGGFNPSWYSNLYSGCVLHVCPQALSEFVKFLPEIKVAFKLLTNNSDMTLPDDFNESQQILNNPFLIKWYAQNCIGTHEKLVRIPIGLDYHSMRPSGKKLNIWERPEKHLWGFKKYATEQESELISFNKEPFWTRRIKAYANFQLALHTRFGEKRYIQDRKDAMKIPLELVDYETTWVYRNVCWSNMAKYAFVLSPQGNGLDCHRTWEVLCLGSIAIVKTSGLDSLFDDLPVWIVEDWSEVTQENMIKKIEEFKVKSFKYEKLTLAYWRNILNE